MYKSLEKRIDRLPLVIAGPIIRHTTPEETAIWLVLRSPRRISMRVVAMDTPADTLLTGEAETLPLGANLHFAVVRAHGTTPIFSHGVTYGYDLQFLDPTGRENLESFDQAVDGLKRITYPPHPLPGFVLPGKDLEDVHLLYGSCRKPHGEGVDAMVAIDQILEQAVHGARPRPQQLYLSGDQIYADDVADSLLVMVMDCAQTLMGEPETLPGKMKPRWLRPSCRERTVRRRAGFTSRFCKSHVIRLSEFLMLYLMGWSDVLWPEDLPAFDDIFDRRAFFPPGFRGTGFSFHGRLGKRRGSMETSFEMEQAHLERFRRQLHRVRRALANISTYMIFDDHEITDDWYLNRAWTTTVLRKPLGRRIVANGLVAFALCQGWGNHPSRYERGPEAELLRETSKWIATAYQAEGAEKLEQLLGLPDTTEPPAKLDRDPEKTCRWDFRVFGPAFEVWVLDTRTWRGFSGARPTAIPDLISGQGWQQLSKPLKDKSRVTLVIAPTNVIDVPLTAWASKTAARFLDVYFADYGDSWEAQTGAFEELLSRLAQQAGPGEGRFVFLSGDVHYSFATRIQYWTTHPYKGLPLDGPADNVLAQLTASPFKNENSMTRFLHRRGYWPRFPKPIAWAGWNTQPWLTVGSFRGRLKNFYLGFKKRSVRHHPPLLNLENLPRRLTVEPSPDWRYRIDFLHGTREGDHKPGRDIVGLNNLGELVFVWNEAAAKCAVIQKLWWSEDLNHHFQPFTQLQVDLNHASKTYPKPHLPQENQT